MLAIFTCPVPFGLRSKLPLVSVVLITLPSNLILSIAKLPDITVAPVLVSNVKLELSLIAPLAPANKTLPAVKSVTCNSAPALTTTSPVPFGSRIILPLLSVLLIVLPFKSKLSTLRLSSLLLASAIRALLAVRVPWT